MGLRVVDATKAWRMRRTRGDIARRRRRVVERALLAGFFGLGFDFAAVDFLVEASGELCPPAGIAAEKRGIPDIALSSPPARASIREYLRQIRTTLFFTGDPESRTC
jgi:hypothetical protein